MVSRGPVPYELSQHSEMQPCCPNLDERLDLETCPAGRLAFERPKKALQGTGNPDACWNATFRTFDARSFELPRSFPWVACCASFLKYGSCLSLSKAEFDAPPVHVKVVLANYDAGGLLWKLERTVWKKWLLSLALRWIGCSRQSFSHKLRKDELRSLGCVHAAAKGTRSCMHASRSGQESQAGATASQRGFPM